MLSASLSSSPCCFFIFFLPCTATPPYNETAVPHPRVHQRLDVGQRSRVIARWRAHLLRPRVSPSSRGAPLLDLLRVAPVEPAIALGLLLLRHLHARLGLLLTTAMPTTMLTPLITAGQPLTHDCLGPLLHPTPHRRHQQGREGPCLSPARSVASSRAPRASHHAHAPYAPAAPRQWCAPRRHDAQPGREGSARALTDSLTDCPRLLPKRCTPNATNLALSVDRRVVDRSAAALRAQCLIAHTAPAMLPPWGLPFGCASACCCRTGYRWCRFAQHPLACTIPRPPLHQITHGSPCPIHSGCYHTTRGRLLYLTPTSELYPPRIAALSRHSC